ncbi:MAG TPA: GGDEF domain-containing protein [Pseudolabrys sp.]|nr:GGDEF domain-containing protein [Pseudolabrys sp.]
METRSSALPTAAAGDFKPVAVTRWSARLADPQCERAFLESRFADDRRRVFVLLAFITASGVLIVGGRLIAFFAGHGPLTALLPPVLPVLVASFAAFVLLRVKSPQALEIGFLTFGVVLVIIRFAMLTVQPAMTDSWLPLMVTSLFIIYVYLPVRLLAAAAFAAFYSTIALTWWVTVHGAALGAEHLYFGVLWVMLANGLGFAAANALQRSQRTQFAQSLLLRRLLSTDSLTGIGNRRRFDDALAREWRRCRRAGMPMSLLMIDVDHFKAYNDHYGHQQGDDCLRQVARLLVDGAGRPGDLVSRYGGEEFLCMLPDTGMAGALAVADKLAATVRQADIHHPRSPAGARLTISIGAATAKDLSGEPEALAAFADKLLYAAKAAGRNQVKVGQLGLRKAEARAA